MRFAICGFLGFPLHLLLLLLPLILLSQVPLALSNASVFLFLLLASSFYLADLCGVRARHIPERFTSSKEQTEAYRLGLITGLCMLVIFWVALVENTASEAGCVRHWRWAGGSLMACGVYLRYSAIRMLGPFFISEITVKRNQPLVQAGMYRFMRHPSETGNLAIVFGACVLLGSPIGLALCSAVFVPVVLCRVRLEDRYLERVFGEEFRAFATRVKRLVPMVY